MINLQNNRLNAAALSQADLSTAKNAFQQLNSLLQLIGLTVQERKNLPKINTTNAAFVEECLLVAHNNPNLLPDYLKVEEMQQDFTLYRQLDELLLLCSQLQEKLRDTQMLAGSEAYLQALATYHFLATAAKAGIPGTDTLYEQLRVRFARHGKKSHPDNTDDK